jgi:hypothetical protein
MLGERVKLRIGMHNVLYVVRDSFADRIVAIVQGVDADGNTTLARVPIGGLITSGDGMGTPILLGDLITVAWDYERPKVELLERVGGTAFDGFYHTYIAVVEPVHNDAVSSRFLSELTASEPFWSRGWLKRCVWVSLAPPRPFYGHVRTQDARIYDTGRVISWGVPDDGVWAFAPWETERFETLEDAWKFVDGEHPYLFGAASQGELWISRGKHIEKRTRKLIAREEM